jgi:hypothetical protein
MVTGKRRRRRRRRRRIRLRKRENEGRSCRWITYKKTHCCRCKLRGKKSLIILTDKTVA